MRFVSFIYNNYSSIGVVNKENTKIIDIYQLSDKKLPNNMFDYLQGFDNNNDILKVYLSQEINKEFVFDLDKISILSPLPNPNSFRDAYAFRQHVEAGRKNRGLDMIPEYDEFPVFYFSNHNSISGPGEVLVQHNHMDKLDFEFEIAIVISKEGKNIKKEDAHNYIAGFIIMNDWSARGMQFKEMKLNLGPAKGKDFATSIGPYLVTLEELKDYEISGKDGVRYDLKMRGYINDNLVSKDNFKNISWTFSQIIERASYGVSLYPGDLIGSGTCATGCLLENNMSKNDSTWLKNGDVIKLQVDCLGTLVNTISLQ